MPDENPRGAVGALVVAALALGACGNRDSQAEPTPPSGVSGPAATHAAGARTPNLPATPAGAADAGRCQAPADPLPSLTEGPYFKEGSPERMSVIEPTTAGERLLLSGTVYDTDCMPVSGAKLDFWQADGNGEYDNAAFRLRGHQFTDSAGHFQLITVVPGLYPGRTEHIHIKIQPPGGEVLTTQLFFPEVVGNQTDRIFDPRLVIQMERASEGWAGAFDFIVKGP